MFLVIALGCAKQVPAATPTEPPATTQPAPEPASAAEPHAQLRGLLQAHHPDDLPDQEALDAHGAPEGLRWLAENDDLLVIRERALLLLRHYDDDASQSLCAGVFDSDAHAKLRAAAIRCLGGSDLTTDDTLRNKLLAAVRDADPRVGVAAVDVLAEVPAAGSGLRAALDDPALTDPVRSRLTEVVGAE